MSLKHTLFVTLFVTAVSMFAQRNSYGTGNYNRLGIQGGYSIFDINTSDLITEARGSFTGGFTTRGSFRNDFDLIYGINFVSNKLAVKTHNPASTEMLQNTAFVNLTMIGAQINFLASYNIVRHHVSIEVGPILNVNSKLKSDSESFESEIVDGYVNTTVKDLENISTFNGAAHIGITGGLESFRISVSYQYGFTNILGALNDDNLENQDFKGNTSNLNIVGIVYF